jgi:hypothetical protein
MASSALRFENLIMMAIPGMVGTILLTSGCHTQHIVTVHADRSAVIRNSTTLTGLHTARHYRSPTVVMLDTSVLGYSIVVINEVDSLGQYLPTFDPRQMTVSLHDNELSVHFNTAPTLKGWSGSSLTFFVEQGIEKALTSNRKVTLESKNGTLHYATIHIRKKVLNTRPGDLDFTLLLRDAKR